MEVQKCSEHVQQYVHKSKSVQSKAPANCRYSRVHRFPSNESVYSTRNLINSIEIFGPIGQGCETKFEGKFTLPPPVQGRDQLQALLRRQWLHKVHSLLTEIISFDSDLDVVEILCIFDVQFYSVRVKNPNALLLSVPTRH